MTTFDAMYFAAACDVLVRDVSVAASGGGEWLNPVERASQMAQHVMREARRLGLYPATAQLEAEARRAA